MYSIYDEFCKLLDNAGKEKKEKEKVVRKFFDYLPKDSQNYVFDLIVCEMGKEKIAYPVAQGVSVIDYYGKDEDIEKDLDRREWSAYELFKPYSVSDEAIFEFDLDEKTVFLVNYVITKDHYDEEYDKIITEHFENVNSDLYEYFIDDYRNKVYRIDALYKDLNEEFYKIEENEHYYLEKCKKEIQESKENYIKNIEKAKNHETDDIKVTSSKTIAKAFNIFGNDFFKHTYISPYLTHVPAYIAYAKNIKVELIQIIKLFVPRFYKKG